MQKTLFGQRRATTVSFGSYEATGDLEAIFLETCTRIDARYGFSSDEWILEARFPGAEVLTAYARHLESVRAEEPPYLLFWLNDFSPQASGVSTQRQAVRPRADR